MPELFHVATSQEAWRSLEPYLLPVGRTEIVATKGALRRVLAVDVFAQEALPVFPRSAMDGYAVRAIDTYGASESSPAYIMLAGEVPMGRLPERQVSPGEAALIHTGSLLPQGANAVVMVENTQRVDEHTIEVVRPVAEGENVLASAEDIHRGELLLPRGHLLRPQDLGGLLAVGITEVLVFARPVVAIISTGDELVSPESMPAPGQVRDVNAYSISGFVSQAGGTPLLLGIVPDSYVALQEVVGRGVREADTVVVSAGSSVSARDMTAEVINSLGKPGVLVHGIAIRPGKPTILAVVGGKPVFGLAGNPVSALITCALFVVPTVYRLSGCARLPERYLWSARLTHGLPSAPGREDYVPVRLLEQGGELWAEPIFSKSNFISSLMKADGLARVPLDKTGVEAGEMVAVLSF